jgi:hypothetical protein
MARTKETLVSILGSSYFQPVANLIERWNAFPHHRPNKVQSGFYESGYASSVILLLVAMFESYVVRLRFVQGSKVSASARTALDVVLAVFPRLRHRKALIDVYVLRDSIFHNHLWEIEYSWGGSPTMVMHAASKHPEFGDKKYTARVNPRTRRTRALGVNVVPTRVDRRDVLKVFDTIWKTLLIFEAQGRFQCYVSHENVRFAGKTELFHNVVGQLRSSL